MNLVNHKLLLVLFVKKLKSFPSVKMHNSYHIVNFPGKNSNAVGVFCSLNYDYDLSGSSLCNPAIQKLLTKIKEMWSTHTVRRNWSKLTLIDFKEWLKEKTGGHE